ncbi:cytochrome c3 family protein [Mesoterricola sediminis]|uniref:Tetrahaem cytochrome domain-containing protein n=1 Tax=Mesoterricola sediminis TaxID=2927980 RepID=A0AA48KF81_9BACT|nr:cytochrome c3 family protein [Mesoterricola sediminis]BDU78052.1 hypothetical protein METESE_30100 [Mesoterricola sediminis]
MRALQSLTLIVGCMILSAQGFAADPRLNAKHVKAGVTCHNCHGTENPDKAAVPDSSCYNCHGDYPAMAAYTKALPLNPHAPLKAGHPGPFACVDCHRQHKPPVVKCLECHPDFKLKPR